MKRLIAVLVSLVSVLSATPALASQNAACWDPVTGRLEPCFRGANEAIANGIAACIDPVTKKPEPCFFNLQRGADEAQSVEACWNPETHRLEPCL